MQEFGISTGKASSTIAARDVFDTATGREPWLFGRVPNGYWDCVGNRRRYLKWLGARCGFESPDDWYSVRQQHFKQNGGLGLLGNHYGYSIQAAVRELLPKYPWRPWLFGGVPQRFWRNRSNRVSYMDWLGRRLGFTSDEDWYRITKKCFQRNHGGGLLNNYYNDSPQLALQEYRPNSFWRPWLFPSVPQGFWQESANRRAYMGWLGDRLGYVLLTDWYAVTLTDFYSNAGGGLIETYYGGSVSQALRDFRPDYRWEPERLSLALASWSRNGPEETGASESITGREFSVNNTQILLSGTGREEASRC